MLDISHKQNTSRYASAYAEVHVGKEIIKLIRENQLKKGDVLSVAKLAGIIAAKKTADLIPLCHNLTLTFTNVNLKIDSVAECVKIVSEIRCYGQTGVEMEALTAVTIAALTVYDMCKAIRHDICIKNVKLIKKTGGKTDFDDEKA